MVFSKTWRQVLDGTKTQTRRLVKEGDYLSQSIVPGDAVFAKAYCKWRVRRTYAVQPGRGKPAVGRFRLLHIRRERLQDISIADIRAEGIEKQLTWTSYEMRMAFAELWDSIHRKGDRWIDNPEVWVLKFELAGAAND